MDLALVGDFKQLGALGIVERAGKLDLARDFFELAFSGLALLHAAASTARGRDRAIINARALP